MLKKIKVEDLKLGMHLHEMCGSWMFHPFFRSAFKLTDYADIRRIIDSSIREVWVDSDLGLNVASGESGSFDQHIRSVLMRRPPLLAAVPDGRMAGPKLRGLPDLISAPGSAQVHSWASRRK